MIEDATSMTMHVVHTMTHSDYTHSVVSSIVLSILQHSVLIVLKEQNNRSEYLTLSSCIGAGSLSAVVQVAPGSGEDGVGVEDDRSSSARSSDLSLRHEKNEKNLLLFRVLPIMYEREFEVSSTRPLWKRYYWT